MLNHQRLKFSGVKLEKLYEFLEPSTPWFRLKDEVKGIMSGRASKVITFSRNISIPLSTICRNKCGYCGFRNSTGPLEKRVLSPDEVHDLLQKGAAAGCKEALFIMGEKPEEACPEIRQLVRSWGFRNMIDYLYHLCLLALDMGLLPHSNVGLLEAEEMARLREVNASMGLMLESVSMNLCQQGAAHQLSPGKHPAVRLAHIREAGRQRIPFTTGILVGIGEKPWERVDSILALKRLQEEYGHIQEIIIQNFIPKPGTPMANFPAATMEDMLKTIALTRIVFGPAMNIQAPPNLTPETYSMFLEAGINDWGGISPLTLDAINPEKPWPSIAELEERTRKMGFLLKERLPIYPEYTRKESFLSLLIKEQVKKMADGEGYAREGVCCRGWALGEN